MEPHRSVGGEADQRRWEASLPAADAPERTIPIDDMPYEPWPSVPGLARGDIVVGVEHGRRFRVVANDEWVVTGDFDRSKNTDDRVCTGPYAKLQALDDKNCTVVWPRDWYMPVWVEDLI